MTKVFLTMPDEAHSDRAAYNNALTEWRGNLAKLNAELKRDQMIDGNAEARHERANRDKSDEETMGARE